MLSLGLADRFKSQQEQALKKESKFLMSNLTPKINLKYSPFKNKNIQEIKICFYESLTNQIKELRKIFDNKKLNLNKENSSQNIISEKINNIMFVYLVADDYPPKLLKQFVDDQKNKYQQKCVSLIISSNANKLSIVLGATNDLIDSFDSSKIIQEVSKILGGKGGGGRKDIAQAGGTDLTNLEDAINKIRDSLNF